MWPKFRRCAHPTWGWSPRRAAGCQASPSSHWPSGTRAVSSLGMGFPGPHVEHLPDAAVSRGDQVPTGSLPAGSSRASPRRRRRVRPLARGSTKRARRVTVTRSSLSAPLRASRRPGSCIRGRGPREHLAPSRWPRRPVLHGRRGPPASVNDTPPWWQPVVARGWCPGHPCGWERTVSLRAQAGNWGPGAQRLGPPALSAKLSRPSCPRRRWGCCPFRRGRLSMSPAEEQCRAVQGSWSTGASPQAAHAGQARSPSILFQVQATTRFLVYRWVLLAAPAQVGGRVLPTGGDTGRVVRPSSDRCWFIYRRE